MSRLGDALRKALHTTPPAMGFRPTAPTKPHMALIGVFSEIPGTAVWIQGADAVIFDASLKPKELKSFAKNMSVPWGILLDGSSSRLAEAASADFVVFDPNKTGLEIISNDDLGKIIVIEPSCDNSLLHGIGELPVEAVYLKRAPLDVFTWLDLMQCRRLADLITKPLLIPIAQDTPPAHLKALWEAGADGVVVAATEESSLKDMRRSIDGLNLPPRRKWLRARPLVPLMAHMSPPTQHDEGDEDDE